jgi:hypothetical protein
VALASTHLGAARAIGLVVHRAVPRHLLVHGRHLLLEKRHCRRLAAAAAAAPVPPAIVRVGRRRNESGLRGARCRGRLGAVLGSGVRLCCGRARRGGCAACRIQCCSQTPRSETRSHRTSCAHTFYRSAARIQAVQRCETGQDAEHVRAVLRVPGHAVAPLARHEQFAQRLQVIFWWVSYNSGTRSTDTRAVRQGIPVL